MQLDTKDLVITLSVLIYIAAAAVKRFQKISIRPTWLGSFGLTIAEFVAAWAATWTTVTMCRYLLLRNNVPVYTELFFGSMIFAAFIAIYIVDFGYFTRIRKMTKSEAMRQALRLSLPSAVVLCVLSAISLYGLSAWVLSNWH